MTEIIRRAGRDPALDLFERMVNENPRGVDYIELMQSEAAERLDGLSPERLLELAQELGIPVVLLINVNINVIIPKE